MSALRQEIEKEIRACGPIPFSRYMDLCLYDPELGYYSRHAAQFGKAGDFYTASDVHAVFGRLLARQFEEMWRLLGSPKSIVVKELGPGRGLFAQDVLDWSEKKFPDFFRAMHYSLAEGSPALRERIAVTLARHLEFGKATLASNIQSPAGQPTADRTTLSTTLQPGSEQASVLPKRAANPWALAPEIPQIVFANEFFDALPVEVVSLNGSLRIDSRDGRFVETWAPPSPEELEFLDRYSIHPEADERIEVPLRSQIQMSAAASLERGFVAVIDYGYTRQEQLAGRHRGTLKAIRQHSVSANPYEAPGEQDITSDVNFTALAAAAAQQGMHPEKLITQSQFLLGLGEANQFADAFEECRLPQERAKVALQLKHLVTPAGMGESFHVLVASKEIDQERASTLTGFGFGRKPATV